MAIGRGWGKFFGGNDDDVQLLSTGLNQMVLTSRLTAKSANAQRRGVEAIAKWAKRSRNTAIDDVMQRTAQLFEMFSERQMQFSRDFGHFVEQLKKIAETEQRVQEYENEVSKKEQRLEKIRKRRNRFWSKRSASESERREMAEAQRELSEAQRRLEAVWGEAEVVKMFQFRRGMMGIADAYRNFATTCDMIFSCHREITELVPAVSTQNVNHMQYDGVPYTRERVEEVRRSLESSDIPLFHNPPTAATSSSQQRQSRTPPPPYSAAEVQTPKRNHFSDSQLINSRFIRPTAPQPTPMSIMPITETPKMTSRLYPKLSPLLN